MLSYFIWHTMLYYRPYFVIPCAITCAILRVYMEQTGKLQRSSAQRQQQPQQLCNLSGLHLPNLLHKLFPYHPQSFPLHHPLSSLLLHPFNSVYNLFCKFFNCFSNCLRQNFREIKFFIFLQQNYFQLCKLPELRVCVGVYVVAVYPCVYV